MFATSNDDAHRYRCFTGHTFTEKLLVETHAEAWEESIWVYIRMLEERRGLLRKLAEHQGDIKQNGNVRQSLKIAEDMAKYIERLKAFLVTMRQIAILL